MKWPILWLSLLVATAVWGNGKPTDALKPLKETLSRIQKAKLVEFQIEKKVVSDVLQTEKTYHGRAYLQGPLFRLEIKDPEKSLIVYDGKTLWIVQYLNADLGGPVQVLRGQVKGKQKEQLLMTELLAKGRLLASFDLKKTGEENGMSEFEALPKDKSFNLQKVILAVKDKELKKLEYVDDIGNKTSLRIVEQKLLGDRRPELFRYKPEKGAQVTDL